MNELGAQVVDAFPRIAEKMLKETSPFEITDGDSYDGFIERLERAEKSKDDRENVKQELAAHIEACWKEAQYSKQEQGITDRLISCLMQRNGIYTADVLSEINKQGGSTVYMQLTGVKCRAAESWIRDILRPPSDKPWAITPTPIPDLPDYVRATIEQQLFMRYQAMQGMLSPADMQKKMEEVENVILAQLQNKAKKLGKSVEEKIHDDFTEGNWYDALDQVVSDIVTFPTAFMTGPIIRKKRTRRNAVLPDGTVEILIEDKLVTEYERVSPFDIYPAPSARTLNDGYLIHKQSISKAELIKCIGAPGYNEEAIRSVLEEVESGQLSDSWLYGEQDRADLESREEDSQDKSGKMDSLIFWGPVQGKILLEWGMDEDEIPDELMEYEICARKIGNYVIKAIVNPDKMGIRPYYAASYEKVPDSIWGKSPPELMVDIQNICNACARALVNNMGISSGPQVSIDISRTDKDDVEAIYPWKIWQFTKDETGSQQTPIEFFQPNPMADMLIKIYDYFFKQASEVTGIPNYVYGMSDTTGAANTASGLSMLMNSASKGIKMVIFHIDDGIIKPSVQNHYNHVMLYGDDQSLKQGDIVIVAKGSSSLIMEEQRRIRLNEFMTIAANPVYAEIMGRRGIANLLRETIKGLDMPMDSIIPSDEELETAEKQQEIGMFLSKISQVFGIPVEQLMQVAFSPPQQGMNMVGGQGGGNGQPQGLLPSPQNPPARAPGGEQRYAGADYQLMQQRG